MRIDIVNGYRMVYFPDHPSSYTSGNWKGWIYEHRKVMEDSLGRTLLKGEIVHHKDENKLNNNISNLEVMMLKDHAFMHATVFQKKICACGNEMSHKQKYCSIECVFRFKTKCPTKEDLTQHLKDKLSNCAVGRIYSVSDNTVKNWYKKYNLT